jgi:hypothetical protein
MCEQPHDAQNGVAISLLHVFCRFEDKACDRLAKLALEVCVKVGNPVKRKWLYRAGRKLFFVKFNYRTELGILSPFSLRNVFILCSYC